MRTQEKVVKDAKVIPKSKVVVKDLERALETKKKASSYTCTKSQCSHTGILHSLLAAIPQGRQCS